MTRPVQPPTRPTTGAASSITFLRAAQPSRTGSPRLTTGVALPPYPKYFRTCGEKVCAARCSSSLRFPVCLYLSENSGPLVRSGVYCCDHVLFRGTVLGSCVLGSCFYSYSFAFRLCSCFFLSFRLGFGSRSFLFFRLGSRSGRVPQPCGKLSPSGLVFFVLVFFHRCCGFWQFPGFL